MTDSLGDGVNRSAKLYQAVGLPDEDSIRLLDLLPGTHKEIRANLRTVSLSSKPQYEALSYTWGASELGKTISINKYYRLPVTDSVFRALRRLRRRFCVRTLWIDALCINQNDSDERMQQVGMMREIYQTAKVVDVWLGEPGRWSSIVPRPSLAFQRLVYAVMAHTKAGQLRSTSLMIQDARMCWELLCSRFEAMNSASQHTSPRWKDRVWTMQEFVMARNVVFYFGRHHLTYERDGFGRMWQWLGMSNNDYHCADLLERLIEQLGFLKNRFAEGLVDVMWAAKCVSNCSATDSRDLVYGFPGLVQEEEARLIPSDYTVACAKTFARATHASLKVRQDFRLLQLVTLRDRRREDLPTWAVDFSALQDAPSIITEADYTELEPNLEKRNFPYETPTLDTSCSRVSISATFCDTVQEVFPLTIANIDRDIFRPSQALRDFVAAAVASAKHALNQQPCQSNHSPQVVDLLTQLLALESCGTFDNTAYGTDFIDRAMQYAVDRWFKGCYDVGLTRTTSTIRSQISELINWFYYAKLVGTASIIRTSCGLIGFAPGSVAKGDIIVLYSGSLPFLVLRPMADGLGEYEFCGLPYIHGLMEESFWKKRWNGQIFESQRFTTR